MQRFDYNWSLRIFPTLGAWRVVRCLRHTWIFRSALYDTCICIVKWTLNSHSAIVIANTAYTSSYNTYDLWTTTERPSKIHPLNLPVYWSRHACLCLTIYIPSYNSLDIYFTIYPKTIFSINFPSQLWLLRVARASIGLMAKLRKSSENPSLGIDNVATRM